MDMKVALPLPVPPLDFNFDSTSSSPYITAPSSPTRFGNNNYFFSAPTSPTRASAFYRHLNDLDNLPTHYSPSNVPFKWEHKPGIPKSTPTINGHDHRDDDQDFEFDFSGQLERASLPADELFDGGKIRPLKPPPRLQVATGSAHHDPGPSSLSPRSPSPRSKKTVQKVVSFSSSPRQYKNQTNNFDPFTAAMEETTSEDHSEQQRRGRERIMPLRNASVRKGSRSLSPLRVSDITFHLDDVVSPSTTTRSTNSNNNNNNNNNDDNNNNSVSKPSTSSSWAYSSFLSAISFSKGSNRKWKLKDLLLFRSASEGRATTTGKDPLRKYTMLSMNKKSGGGGGGGGSSIIAEDVKNSSFRSTDSVGSVSSRRRGPVSPHELHYTVNRAVSEEMKRKTFLPYKHGLLGCLGFNNGLHEISRGAFGSLARG